MFSLIIMISSQCLKNCFSVTITKGNKICHINFEIFYYLVVYCNIMANSIEAKTQYSEKRTSGTVRVLEYDLL